MIWLIDEGYTIEDIEYIHEILDELLTYNRYVTENVKIVKN